MQNPYSQFIYSLLDLLRDLAGGHEPVDDLEDVLVAHEHEAGGHHGLEQLGEQASEQPRHPRLRHDPLRSPHHALRPRVVPSPGLVRGHRQI